MATNSRVFRASREAVWQVLTDGRAYSLWVVGPRAIRDVDPSWPAPRSRLHYRIGRGPFSHDGHTEVLAVEDGKRLELEAHAWPVGTARIELTVEDSRDGGCRVRMVEHPEKGTAAVLHNPIGDALLKLRNFEALRRLERLAGSSSGQ